MASAKVQPNLDVSEVTVPMGNCSQDLASPRLASIKKRPRNRISGQRQTAVEPSKADHHGFASSEQGGKFSSCLRNIMFHSKKLGPVPESNNDGDNTHTTHRGSDRVTIHRSSHDQILDSMEEDRPEPIELSVQEGTFDWSLLGDPDTGRNSGDSYRNERKTKKKVVFAEDTTSDFPELIEQDCRTNRRSSDRLDIFNLREDAGQDGYYNIMDVFRELYDDDNVSVKSDREYEEDHSMDNVIRRFLFRVALKVQSKIRDMDVFLKDESQESAVGEDDVTRASEAVPDAAEPDICKTESRTTSTATVSVMSSLPTKTVPSAPA